MHIKRFKARTLEEALKEVKSIFGDDSVILSTSKGKSYCEVIAAIDFDIEDIEKGFGVDAAVENGLSGIREEVSELKTLFASVLKETATRDMAGLGSGTLELYKRLISNGVNDNLSNALVRAAVGNQNGDSNLADGCLRLIKGKATVCNPLVFDSNTKLFALVGPTGAGKTTTILKLVGKMREDNSVDVGLVSLDNKRPGANEVLKECGRRYGVEVDLPGNKEEFNKALWKNRTREVVLIDTPGINPNDSRKLGGLRNILTGGHPIKLGLVLNLTSADDMLASACKGFGKLPLECLVFTRADEVRRFGAILNAITITNKPVAYLCNGQRVPLDIGVASVDRIGELVMGRGTANV